jgi:hypothetical protein
MDRQPALFPEMESAPSETQPPGFRYREEIITGK